MTSRDEADPRLTAALAAWSEDAVPALPDDFTAKVMAEVAAARAMGAWVDDAVPALPDDFTAKVMAEVASARATAAWVDDAVPALPEDFAASVAAKAAARPKLQAIDGGAAATEPAKAAPRARRAWLWPVVAVAAAGLLALWTSRSTPPGGSRPEVAHRTTPDVPAVLPEPGPVMVAMAAVTRVDVVGVQSVAVMSVDEEGGGVASPVVWITDKDEDDGTRMQ